MLLLLLSTACSKGSFSGEVTQPDTAPPEKAGKTGGKPGNKVAPAPRHENVVFRWESDSGSLSGRIETTLPDGEVFNGRYHELTRTTAVAEVGDFYDTWYADTWNDPSWYWGDEWPYYASAEEFVTNYTGKVVATLTSPGGTKMRCRFSLDAPDQGIKGGGSGECQLSNGERITAKFPPS